MRKDPQFDKIVSVLSYDVSIFIHRCYAMRCDVDFELTEQVYVFEILGETC